MLQLKNYSTLISKALPHILAIGSFLLISIFYCHPALQGNTLKQSDILQYKAMARESFEYNQKYGHYPLWIESAFSGMPAYTIASNFSAKYEASHFFSDIIKLGLPEPISMFFVACVCFYILMCVLKINPWVSVLCAIAYTFSTYNPIIIATGHVTKMWAIAYAPGVLAAFLLLLKKKIVWGLPLFILFFSQQLGTQHFQIVYYTIIALFIFGLAYIYKAIRAKTTKQLLIPIGATVAGGIIAMGVTMASLLPNKEYAKETTRGGRTELSKKNSQESKDGLSKKYAFEWSYGIGETMTLIVPNAMGGGQLNKIDEDKSDKFIEDLTTYCKVNEDDARQYANAVTYWGPEPFTSGPVYIGAIIVILSIFSLFIVKSKLKWVILGTGVLGILMAWGDHFAAFNYLIFDLLPYYNKFRAPSTSLFLTQLALPMLAGMGLNELITTTIDKKTFKKFLKISIGIVGVMTLFFFSSFKSNGKNTVDSSFRAQLQYMSAQTFANVSVSSAKDVQNAIEGQTSLIMGDVYHMRSDLYTSDAFRSVILIGIVIGLIYLLLQGKIKYKAFVISLLVLTTYDLLSVDARYLSPASYVDPDEMDNTLVSTNEYNYISQDKTIGWRVYDMSVGNPYESAYTSNFANSIGGYSPVKLGLYQDIIDSQLVKGNPRVFDMLNVKYIVTRDLRGQPLLRINSAAFGPCWFVKGIHYVKTGDEEMKALDSIPVRDSVIVRSKYLLPPFSYGKRDTTASIQLVSNTLENILYRYTSNTPQFAVFSEVYYDKGWEAYIDNKRVSYYRVDYVLRGMQLPAGIHTITFKFDPKSYKEGLVIANIANVLIYLLLLFAAYRTIKEIEVGRRQSTSPPTV